MGDAEREIAAALLVAEARAGDLATFNWLCFKAKDGRRWETQAFQKEWDELIKRHDRIVILAPAGHGKSEQISRSWVLRKIAENPNMTGAIVSNTDNQATNRMRLVAQDIRVNEAYHAVFPHVRMEARKDYWPLDSDKGFIVERQIPGKDPTIQAVGIHGAILGSRLDWAVVDDPCDMENTWTSAQREKALKWITSTLISRFDGRGKIIVIQTSWHEDDIGHALAAKHGFKLVRYEACDENFKNILWPAKYDEALLRHMHQFDPGPIEFARTMRNIIMSDEFRRIKYEWIQQALLRGRGVRLGEVPPGVRFVICGLDPAGGKKKREGRGDFSAFFVIAIYPNGDRQVVDCFAARMTSPELKERIKVYYAQYACKIAVEDNGTQDWLRQEVVNETAIPIVGRSTTSNKWDPATGVESIGLELQNGKWIIPATAEGQPANDVLRKWIDEMLSFQIGAHTGDLLMASYIARNMAREEEARQGSSLEGIMLGSDALIQSGRWSV